MTMPAGHERNADQIAYWNGAGGQHWVHRQEMQEGVLGSVTEILVARSNVKSGERVLDVGCGCGATTFAFAGKVGSSGRVLGVDISAPMLARAREITPPQAPVDFVLADATVHAFAPASFDLMVSRFGVMFFADPAVSFANIRKALRPASRMVFACWRTPRDNPWLMVPLQAAYQHVPKMPQLGPEDPGPFAFADEERVRRILTEAGFSSIALERSDLSMDVAGGRGLDAAVTTALEIGPASRALDGQPPDKVAAATASIREALAKFVKGDSVPLGGSIWVVTATNP
jgi:ubiquinone/menaquinone biosynthesis C-methylase UbiE